MARPLNDPSGPGVVMAARVPQWLKEEVEVQAAALGLPYGRTLQMLVEAGLRSVGLRQRDADQPVDGELDFEIADEIDVAHAQLRPEVICPAEFKWLSSPDHELVVSYELENRAGNAVTFQLDDLAMAQRLLGRKCYVVLMSGPGGGE